MNENQSAAKFFENVAQIIENARSFAGRTANLTMCITYYEVGRMIDYGGRARNTQAGFKKQRRSIKRCWIVK